MVKILNDIEIQGKHKGWQSPHALTGIGYIFLVHVDGMGGGRYAGLQHNLLTA